MWILFLSLPLFLPGMIMIMMALADRRSCRNCKSININVSNNGNSQEADDAGCHTAHGKNKFK